MLHIIQSNRMEALQAQFTTLLKQAPLTDPFANDIVLVQSPGMSQWLKNGLSRDIGYAAQVEFPLPLSFIWQLYQQFLPDVPKESPFNKNNMSWKLFTLLPQQLSNPLYEPLRAYLEDASDQSQSELKRFALCEKIADVYDQYLMYRPNWLEQWEQGMDTLEDVDINIAPWQPDLWRILVAHTHQLGQSPYNRANMHQQLLTKLAEADPTTLPERICIFGLSAMATNQLEIFTALAQKSDVILFFFNPSEHYWGDLVDEKTQAKILAKYRVRPAVDAQLQKQSGEASYYNTGNPLLSSWGKLGRDYLEQLLQTDARWLDGFVDQFGDSLLAQLQREIYQLAFKGESLVDDPNWYVSAQGRLTIEQADSSLLLCDCHTPLREVELLHDHLLGLFHEDPTLTPKDIIVMMPDVGTYSPYIEAVFGSASGVRKIPFALADMSIDQEKPVLNSFVTLVGLPFSRFSVSDILDLLGVEPISNRFVVEQSEFVQIQTWLQQVAVKWGLNGEHKGDYGLPEIALNTWQHGLKRLLLGIASADELTAYNEIYPADAVEGMAVNTLSKLIAFIEALAQAREQLLVATPLDEKCAVLRQMLADFYDQDTEQSWDLMQLHKVIDGLEKHHENGDFAGAVDAKIVLHQVRQGIKDKGVGQRFLAGAVNFCTLMPMRAVPFKVVCLLGMNDADYPRQVQPIGFDLVPYSRRRKGDRSRKLDDRYLFLEALLSARQHLYISYLGRSCYNNEPQVPSILVSELCEYLDRAFCYPDESLKPSEQVYRQAPLQPFSNQHYLPGTLHSFNPNWCPSNSEKHTEVAQQNTESAIEVELDEELELPDFLRACLAPQRWFYQHTLGVRLVMLEEDTPDSEPFALDPLTRYQYLDEILHSELNDAPLPEAQLLQRAQLPQANVGVVELQKLKGRVAAMSGRLKDVMTEHVEPIEVSLRIGTTQLLGWLANVYQSKQVFYRTASIKGKDRIRGYLMHLIANCVTQDIETHIYGLDEQVVFAPLGHDEAHKQLSKWLAFYAQLVTRAVPFFPATSYEYCKTQDMSKALNKFVGGQYIGFGDSEDPYVALSFPSLQACEAEFVQLSSDLLTPLIDLAQETRYETA
ncbi:exodeoxyribonuclease V subunit gamma [Pseudoalteromonas rubra]|uniref:RecBCD enzyme subunit RecC n=1 Tax=Pseudoalteromonas rubra TaxID=43658 RepID=A0A5S3UQR9_9GAMM|nr:exodeoxyribonuclease V subunit gamma [Pseudoalteromonas rubra]QPB83852.1 exodeoxyribonuclease V subunit gamma [Pseudoalteromonas rubra]